MTKNLNLLCKFTSKLSKNRYLSYLCSGELAVVPSPFFCSVLCQFLLGMHFFEQPLNTVFMTQLSIVFEKYISKVKQIISFCFSLLVVSILVCATSILTIRIHTNEIIYYILLGVTIIWLILAVVLAVMLTIQYKKDTKV